MRRKTLKKAAIFFGLALAGLIVTAVGLKMWWDANVFSAYQPEAPLNLEMQNEDQTPAYRRTQFSFEGVPGHPVPAVLFTPNGEGDPWPCVVFLHGIGQDKSFAKTIAPAFIDSGFALASFDQLTRGERVEPEEMGPLGTALKLRQRAAWTIIETRRIVQCLQQFPEIRDDGIYLVGASFGAICGATAAALEPRIQAAVLTYGGGNLPVLLNSQMAQEELGNWSKPAAHAAAFILAPLDPIGYVDQIAPRPVLMQCGTRDSVVPFEAGKALFDAAREPKELAVYDSDHIGMDPKLVQRVLADTLTWLERQESRRTPQPN